MTQDPDRYCIPARRAEALLVEMRSRFLAVAAPALTEAESVALLQRERDRYHDATHHCYAWRIGELERHSDDGEPAGTAGKPIVAAIEHSGVECVAVVVTRYFGGVKLGPGGLVRAYGGAARKALAEAGAVERFHTGRLTVSFDFDLTSPVHHALQQFEARTLESSYTDRARLCVEVRRSRLAAFRAALLDSTSGRVEFQD